QASNTSNDPDRSRCCRRSGAAVGGVAAGVGGADAVAIGVAGSHGGVRVAGLIGADLVDLAEGSAVDAALDEIAHLTGGVVGPSEVDARRGGSVGRQAACSRGEGRAADAGREERVAAGPVAGADAVLVFAAFGQPRVGV